MARPVSSYTEEMAARICDRLATTTDSMRTICAEEGFPSPMTVYLWLKQQPAFVKAYNEARVLQAQLFAESIMEIADEDPTVTIPTQWGSYTARDSAGVNRNRLRIDAVKWHAAHTAPKKYGDKVQQEITGVDGGPLVFQVERMGKR